MKYYAGIDLGGTFIKAGIVDESGNIPPLRFRRIVLRRVRRSAAGDAYAYRSRKHYAQ